MTNSYEYYMVAGYKYKDHPDKLRQCLAEIIKKKLIERKFHTLCFDDAILVIGKAINSRNKWSMLAFLTSGLVNITAGVLNWFGSKVQKYSRAMATYIICKSLKLKNEADLLSKYAGEMEEELKQSLTNF